MDSRVIPPLALMALTLSLSACGDSLGSRPGGQALVRVNSDEITMRQVNYVLAHLPESQRRDKELTRKIAEQFVDQQLLLQKALENELDRDPNVLLALEQVRRQTLAQAYLDKITRQVTEPDRAEIKAYYERHPELFANRRLYQVQQIVVSKSIPFAVLNTKAKSGMNTDQLIRWLRSKKLLVGMETSLSPAEKISTEVLPKLHALKKGKRLAWETPEHHVVVVLLDATPQPLSEPEATPVIREFLANEKRKARGQEELVRLRQSATIQWVGELTELSPSIESRIAPGQSWDPYQLSDDNAQRGVLKTSVVGNAMR